VVEIADALLEQSLHAFLMISPLLEMVLEDVEQDQVEDSLPLPEVVLRQRDEGAEQALEGNEQTAGEAAVAANRERDVPLPEMAPVAEVTCRLITQEVLDFRWGPGAGAVAIGPRFQALPRWRLRR
jgi:hypothetical protein